MIVRVGGEISRQESGEGRGVDTCQSRSVTTHGSGTQLALYRQVDGPPSRVRDREALAATGGTIDVHLAHGRIGQSTAVEHQIRTTDGVCRAETGTAGGITDTDHTIGIATRIGHLTPNGGDGGPDRFQSTAITLAGLRSSRAPRLVG